MSWAGKSYSDRPADALKDVLPKLDEAQCDDRVLLALALPEDAQALAIEHKGSISWWPRAEPTEPNYQPEDIEGTNSNLIHTGMKGMYACVIGLYDDPSSRCVTSGCRSMLAFFPIPRKARTLASYQDALKQSGLEGLGVSPLNHSSGRTFVGTQTCGECHTKALAVWEKTKHAQATESLVHPPERRVIPRQHDPECLSCHVTGWDPQSFFPFSSGYLSVVKTPEMMQNGCENCHGPGSAHVARKTITAASSTRP